MRSAGSPCMSCSRARAGRDTAINGDFDQSLAQQIAAPSAQVKEKRKLAFLDPHTDFPEGYGRDRGPIFLQRVCNGAASLRPQLEVAMLLP